MSTMFYSQSLSAFFSSALHKDIPSDATEIDHETHGRLLEGQSRGLEIAVDSGGKPTLIEPTKELPLSTVKQRAKSEVDRSAEAERMKYITPGQGQAMTYQQKVEEAKAYQAATNPKASDYPMLSAEVGITAPTLKQVVEVVLAAFLQWQIIGAEIEGIRLKAKKDIEEAKDEAAVRAVVEAIKWP